MSSRPSSNSAPCPASSCVNVGSQERQLSLLVGGSILVGVRGGGGLLARVDPAESADLLADAGPLYAQVADMGGKDMGPSWLDVHPDAVADEVGLTHWVDACLRRGE